MREKDLRTAISSLKERLFETGLVTDPDTAANKLGFSPETALDLFISRTINYALHDDASVNDWIQSRRANTQLLSAIMPIKTIDNWVIDEDTGNIEHESGRFFSVAGIKVRHRHADQEQVWDQPIIDQPEVGILGILAKKINGVLHFCLNAKEEPGNIGSVQLSPTVQATYSNYTQVHGGRLPYFAEHFFNPPAEKIIFSKLQTEDGGRFLFKSNRNMVVLVENDEVALPTRFIWLTLRQIHKLTEKSNLVNSCARSVLACLI